VHRYVHKPALVVDNTAAESAQVLGHSGTRTTEAVYIQGKEVIDMTSAAFESFGNQFGNQTAEGSH
jgi:hypothetical protein